MRPRQATRSDGSAVGVLLSIIQVFFLECRWSHTDPSISYTEVYRMRLVYYVGMEYVRQSPRWRYGVIAVRSL